MEKDSLREQNLAPRRFVEHTEGMCFEKRMSKLCVCLMVGEDVEFLRYAPSMRHGIVIIDKVAKRKMGLGQPAQREQARRGMPAAGLQR